jgi:hypothetical protein
MKRYRHRHRLPLPAARDDNRFVRQHCRCEAAETHATSLDLSGLSLQQLPESLGQLTALQVLYLSGNQLSALPESLGQVSKLRELYLHDNPGLGLPAEVLGSTWQEIFANPKTPASPKSILDLLLP